MNTFPNVGFGKNNFIGKDKIFYQRMWKSDHLSWDVLAQVMDHGNPELLSHSIRVAELAAKIARSWGLTDNQVELIIRASLFHDIGKLGIPQSILSKPGALTPVEYESIKTHPNLGAALLQECPDTLSLIPIVRHHHEFFNGMGYPDGIGGNKIEIEARIISVADAIDAMSSSRPYRQVLSSKQIILELRRCAGTQFDPIVVKTAIQVLEEMELN